MQGFTIASAFLNYAPCIVGSLPAGVAITAAGIEFSPTGRLRVWPQDGLGHASGDPITTYAAALG